MYFFLQKLSMKKVSFSQISEKDEDLSPEAANELYKEGGFYIVKNLPPGTEFGCDMKSWNTGEKFLGLKMIPAGIHYIYYSPVSKDKDVAPRRGFFIHIDPGQVLVHRFDPDNEEIVDDVSSEEMDRFRSNLKNIDGNLGVYPYNSWSKWVSLSNRIDLPSITKYKCINDGNSLDVGYQFTDIPKQKYPDEANAAEITKYSLDSSYQLEKFLQHHSQIEAVLTELQLSFILFLIGQDFDSFTQWKLIIDMLCNCGDALLKYSKLYKSFLNDLHFQVR